MASLRRICQRSSYRAPIRSSATDMSAKTGDRGAGTRIAACAAGTRRRERHAPIRNPAHRRECRRMAPVGRLRPRCLLQGAARYYGRGSRQCRQQRRADSRRGMDPRRSGYSRGARVIAAIPKFADGGIAYGPTLGLFGEYAGASNNPEVVAPLDKLRSLINPAGGVMAGRVEFVIDGRRLVGVLNNVNRYNERTR